MSESRRPRVPDVASESGLFPPLITTAIDSLPLLRDELALALVTALVMELVEAQERLRSVREVLHAALAHSHSDHLEIARLQERLRHAHEVRRQRGVTA